MIKTNRVTLRDIAERTGYTVNTVSRALHHRDDISKKPSITSAGSPMRWDT